MDERQDAQFRFLLEIDKLKTVLRRSVLSDQSRRENSAEHSWHLATIALCLQEYAEGPIDILKVLTMLLLHDIVEIDAGDVFVHSSEQQETQREKEVVAARRIFSLLPPDQSKNFYALWEEFDSGNSAEAKFARVIDRVEPVMLHEATDAIIWRQYGVTHSQILRRLGSIEKDAPRLWPRVKRVIDQALASGALIRD
jgi:5'-deoxynucleotidase YfbR-like HD superfamily hydrolase